MSKVPALLSYAWHPDTAVVCRDLATMLDFVLTNLR